MYFSHPASTGTVSSCQRPFGPQAIFSADVPAQPDLNWQPNPQSTEALNAHHLSHNPEMRTARTTYVAIKPPSGAEQSTAVTPISDALPAEVHDSSVDRHVSSANPPSLPLSRVQNKFVQSARGSENIHARHRRHLPPQCEICHLTFATSKSRDRHLAVVHKRGANFECSRCHKSIAMGRKDNLRRHERKCLRRP